MAQQENTLGAPTEGLGQNITFAFDPGNGVPQLRPGSAAPVKADVRQAGGAPLELAQAPGGLAQNKTLDLLMNIADKAIGAKVNKIKQQKFVEGMHRAAVGEAVSDIASEQPWWANLFGDAAVVEGARAYSQEANVTRAVTALEDAMPALRQMPYAEAQGHFQKALAASLTGDKATDVAIMQAHSRALPSLMRRQAKEHYAWKQEQAGKAQLGAIGAVADRIQASGAAYAEGFLSDGEMGALHQQLLSLTKPADGQDSENWQRGVAQFATSAAQQGKMHAVNALRVAGLLDALTPEQAAAVETATRRGEGVLVGKMTQEHGKEMAEILAAAAAPEATGLSTEELAARAAALNDRARKKYGTSAGPFSPDELVALRTRSIGAILASQEKARSAALKTDDKEQKAQAIDNAVSRAMQGGSLATLLASPDVKMEDVTSVISNKFAGAKSPQEKAAVVLMAAQPQVGVVKPIASFLESSVKNAIRAGQVDAGALAPAYEQWRAIHERDPATAMQYYGDMGKRLARYHMMISNNVPLAAAHIALLEKPPRVSLDKKEIKEVAEQINDAFSGFLPGWVPGAKKLAPGQEQIIIDQVGGDIEETADTFGGVRQAAGVVLKAAQANRKFEVIGGYAIANSGQPPLAQFLTRPSQHGLVGTVPFGEGEDPHDAVSAAVDRALYGDGKKAGIIKQDGIVPGITKKADSVRLLRMPDVNGVPQLWVMAVVGGEVVSDLITGTDLFKHRDAIKAEAAKPSTLTLGTPIKPAEGAPSIYAGPEEWAAYRARQAAERARK